MNEIVKISFDNDRPTVSGRELHEALEIKTAYKDWFPRMCEYGFAESEDYTRCSNLSTEIQHGGQNKIDHQLTIDMAKQICMIQRTDKGRQCREYFLELEKKWNSPEAVIARALQIANAKLFEIQNQNTQLVTTVAVQEQQIAELQPKASYYDVILNCKDLIAVSTIAKDYGKSAKWMNKYLHEKGVQFKQGDIWLLYKKYAERGYTSTKTSTYNGTDGNVHSKTHTYWSQKGRIFIYDLLKSDGVLPLMEQEETE